MTSPSLYHQDHLEPGATPVSWRTRWAMRWKLLRRSLDSCWWDAIGERDLEAVHALVQLRPDTSKVSDFVVFMALDWSNSTAFNCLLRGGANPNAKNQSNYRDALIHRAACRGLLEQTRTLIACGADIHERDGNDFTALGSALHGTGENAAAWGRERQQVAMLLLQAGARVGEWQFRGRSSALNLSPLEPEILEALIYQSKTFLATNPDPAAWRWMAPPTVHHVAFRLFEDQSVSATVARHTVEVLKKRGGLPSIAPADARLWVKQLFAKDLPDEENPKAWLDLLAEMGITWASSCLDGNRNTLLHLWATHRNFPKSVRWLEVLLEEPLILEKLTQRNADGKTALELFDEGMVDHPRQELVRAWRAPLQQALLEKVLPEVPKSEVSRRPRL